MEVAEYRALVPERVSTLVNLLVACPDLQSTETLRAGNGAPLLQWYKWHCIGSQGDHLAILNTGASGHPEAYCFYVLRESSKGVAIVASSDRTLSVVRHHVHFPTPFFASGLDLFASCLTSMGERTLGAVQRTMIWQPSVQGSRMSLELRDPGGTWHQVNSVRLDPVDRSLLQHSSGVPRLGAIVKLADGWGSDHRMDLAAVPWRVGVTVSMNQPRISAEVSPTSTLASPASSASPASTYSVRAPARRPAGTAAAPLVEPVRAPARRPAGTAAASLVEPVRAPARRPAGTAAASLELQERMHKHARDFLNPKVAEVAARVEKATPLPLSRLSSPAPASPAPASPAPVSPAPVSPAPAFPAPASPAPLPLPASPLSLPLAALVEANLPRAFSEAWQHLV